MHETKKSKNLKVREWPEKIAKVYELQRALLVGIQLLVHVATFPYYRTFNFNTLKPIRLIALYSSQPDKYNKLLFHLDRWRTRKLAELQFVSIACAVVAAAVIGSFSWNAVSDAYWLTSGFWYSSLVLAILGIILAAQQTAVLQLLGPLPSKETEKTANVRRFLPLMLTEVRPRASNVEGQEDLCGIGEWRPRWKMVFTWQCPTMFMSYSIILFLSGLTIFVCTPLIRSSSWNAGSNVAVVYLATGAIAGAAFVFCSFWVYHYVDLEQGLEEMAEMDVGSPSLRLSQF